MENCKNGFMHLEILRSWKMSNTTTARGEWCGRPRGGKVKDGVNVLSDKNYFRATDFKLLRKTKEIQ
jgi:hypothetical protein